MKYILLSLSHQREIHNIDISIFRDGYLQRKWTHLPSKLENWDEKAFLVSKEKQTWWRWMQTEIQTGLPGGWWERSRELSVGHGPVQLLSSGVETSRGRTTPLGLAAWAAMPTQSLPSLPREDDRIQDGWLTANSGTGNWTAGTLRCPLILRGWMLDWTFVKAYILGSDRMRVLN